MDCMDCYCYFLRAGYSYAPVFKKVTPRGAAFAAVMLLGGAILQMVSSTAVARLVNKLDIAAVNELVIIIPAFGWTSFILTTPLGGRSHSRGREGIHTQNDARKITLMAASAVSASTARGISPSDVGECKNAATSANESGSSTGSDGRLVGRLVGDSEVIGRGIVPPGVSLATSLMEKTNGD